MINLFKLDEMLNAKVGIEYGCIEKKIKSYEEELNRIRNERNKEFNALPPNWKNRVAEEDFNYKNELAMKQTYSINSGETIIETDKFSLPVFENISAVGVTIYSDADISGCDKIWEVARKRIAKECGDLEIAANSNGDIFRKYVRYPKNLMPEILNVRKAGLWLKNSKEKEVERVLALGYLSDEILRPAVR